jgi:acyl dehydratase
MQRAPSYDNVDLQQIIGPVTRAPITRVQLAKYAGASGDFNPIHLDDDYAKSVGLGGVIGHGMLTMAFISTMLTDWLGLEGTLNRFGVRFTGMVRPGDVIKTAGSIVGKYIADDNSRRVVIDVWAENQKTEKVAIGTAEVTLP